MSVRYDDMEHLEFLIKTPMDSEMQDPKHPNKMSHIVIPRPHQVRVPTFERCECSYCSVS